MVFRRSRDGKGAGKATASSRRRPTASTPRELKASLGHRTPRVKRGLIPPSPRPPASLSLFAEVVVDAVQDHDGLAAGAVPSVGRDARYSARHPTPQCRGLFGRLPFSALRLVSLTLVATLFVASLFVQSGRRDLNPRHPRWQRGALPLSYSRIIRRGLMFRPAPRALFGGTDRRPRPISSIARPPRIASGLQENPRRDAPAAPRRPIDPARPATARLARPPTAGFAGFSFPICVPGRRTII
jgi:hypothetical protein